jgi:putative membrane protein
MNLAMSPTREKYPLSHRKIIKKTVSSTIAFVLLLGVVWIITLVIGFSMPEDTGTIIGISTLGLLALLILIIGAVYLYQRWYFAVYFYDLTNDYIVIRKGPITPSEITIPYERIQDVYVDQDLLDRIFGIYDVHLSSATVSSGIEAHIDGVEKAAADGLRATLLQTVQERISKHRSAAPAPNAAPTPPPINQ